MTSDFTVHMDEYLPLREVVFNTLRQAILKGELKPGEKTYGDCPCGEAWGEQNSYPGGHA